MLNAPAGRVAVAVGRCLVWCLCTGAIAALVAGCGGGGGGTGGGGADAPPAGASPVARLGTNSLTVEVDRDRTTTTTVVVPLLVVNPPSAGYFYRYRYSTNAIATDTRADRLDQGIDVTLYIKAPGQLGIGVYTDQLEVEVCLDSVCARPITGSPLAATVTVKVGRYATADPGVPPLAVDSTRMLPHDVVDAGYSRSLDALVIVSAQPQPALHLLDLESGVARSVALLTAPTALSIGPDGRRAAVGHDAAVSDVDLAALAAGTAGATVVTRRSIALRVGRLALDGRGRVFAIDGEAFNSNALRMLDLATGADTPVAGSFQRFYGGSRLWLHPDGDRIYGATRNLNPSDVLRLDIGGTGSDFPLSDSPYHGEYEMCGAVWPGADGARLYTACGVTLGSTSTLGMDMRYTGQMTLSPPPSGGGRWLVASLSAEAGRDIVLLERSSLECDSFAPALDKCFTRLATYDPMTLVRKSIGALSPIAIGDERSAQDGRLVFRRLDGRVFVLSRLRHATDPVALAVLTRLSP